MHLTSETSAQLLSSQALNCCRPSESKAQPDRAKSIQTEASTCILGGQQAAHLIHGGEALLLCQRQLSGWGEAPLLQYNYLRHCQHTMKPQKIPSLPPWRTSLHCLHNTCHLRFAQTPTYCPTCAFRLLEGFKALQRMRTGQETSVTGWMRVKGRGLPWHQLPQGEQPRHRLPHRIRKSRHRP